MPHSVTRRRLITEAQRMPTRVGRKTGTNHRGPGRQEGGLGPEYISYFCVSRLRDYCRLYKLTFSDQTQFTLQLTISLSNLVLRFLAGPLLLVARISFLPGLKPALSCTEPRFDPTLVHMGFWVGKPEMGHVSLCVFRFSPISIIPPVLSHISLTDHRSYSALEINNVVK
jgi:hypothetical protein